MKYTVWFSLMQAVVMLAPRIAAAEQTPQKQQDARTPSGSGSLSSALGATTVNRDFPTCMAQTSGAHEKLTAQVLQRKLDSSKDLSPQQRRTIEEDIQWLNAKAAGGRSPAPDPKDPQRFLLVLTDEEQMEINDANNRFATEVREKCEAQYGGMSQFADPAGRRHAPIDTRVELPDLQHAAPPAPAARQPSALEQHKNCMAALPGLRWKIIADHMQRKRAAAGNLPAQERKAWEEDIAVVRAAEQGDGKTTPMSPDPKNPMRYMMRLSPNEQVAVSQEYATASRQMMADCRGGSSASGRSSAPAWSVATSKTAQMREEAKDNAQRAPAQADAANSAQAWLDAHPFRAPAARASNEAATGGGSLSAGLGATRADYIERDGVLACYDRLKGFRAKQTADRLATKRGSVSAQDRQDLEAWITAWRAAEQARLDEPTPPKPSDPQGYLRLITKADQQDLNMSYSAAHNMVMAECNAMDHMETKGKKH